MPVSNRGTNLSVAKSEYYGKKYLAPIADKAMWAGSAISAPELTALAYWYDKGGGKEWVGEKGRRVGEKIAEVQGWLEDRKRQKELIGIKRTEGMKLGSVAGYNAGGAVGGIGTTAVMTGLAFGKGELAARSGVKAMGQASVAGAEAGVALAKGKRAVARGFRWDGDPERMSKYARVAHGRVAQYDAAMLRATHSMDVAERSFRQMEHWNKAGVAVAGIGLAGTAIDMYQEIKRGNEAKRQAKLKTSGDRY